MSGIYETFRSRTPRLKVCSRFVSFAGEADLSGAAFGSKTAPKLQYLGHTGDEESFKKASCHTDAPLRRYYTKYCNTPYKILQETIKEIQVIDTGSAFLKQSYCFANFTVL